MAAYTVGSRGLLTDGGSEHLVLQSRSRYGYAFFLGIFSEKLLTGFTGCFAGSFLLFLEIFLHKTLCLRFGHFEFFVLDHVFDGAYKFAAVETIDVHSFEVVADNQAKGIREFIHVFCCLNHLIWAQRY